jgi:hypothetical protein
VLASWLVPTTALGGEITVQVKGRDGEPITGRRVPIALVQLDDAGELPRFARGRYERTNERGRATFGELDAGSYLISLGGQGGGLVSPDDNPYSSSTQATVSDSDATVHVELELWGGVPVVLQVAVERGEPPSTRASFIHVETGRSFQSTIDETGYVERLLIPGRWRLAIDPPPGYLLVGLEVNGEPVSGHEARLDLEEDLRPSYVTWRYSAPALISGRVDVLGVEQGELDVVATLAEPGPWIAAALERGGSEFRAIEAKWISETLYEMKLPDGKWRVEVVGERLESREPERVDIELPSGGHERVDFTVRFEPDDEGAGSLYVRVRGPERKIIVNAKVELWSVDSLGNPLEPIAEGVTNERQGRVRFPQPPPGDYVAAAVHPGYLEGRRLVANFQPAPDEPIHVVVRLPPASRILAYAEDVDGQSVADVRLDVERLDDPPETLLDVSDQTRQTAVTDASGHARVYGLYPGAYRLQGRLTGALAATRFVKVGRPDGTKQDDVDMMVDPGADIDLELFVLPAASVTGSVACVDDGRLPGAASLRVFGLHDANEGRRGDPELLAGAALALDDVRLGGRFLDKFIAGPLEEGAYQLAVRPTGFGAWTWAFGTERREAGAVVDMEIGESTEVGFVELDCQAGIELRPRVMDGTSLPDMREAEVEARVGIGLDGDEIVWREPRVEQERDAVLLRGLPEGAVRLEVTIRHPHFLPGDELAWTDELELERGWLLPRELEVGGVGGAVVVRSERGPWRLVSDEGPRPRRAETIAGRATFSSLTPGTYRLERCVDRECSSIADTEQVRVEIGRTSRPGN